MSNTKDIMRLTDKLVINPNKFIYGIMLDDELIAYCRNKTTAEIFIQSIANGLETTLNDKNIQISKEIYNNNETGIINIIEQLPISIFNFLNRSNLLHKISYHMIYRGYADNNSKKINKYDEITRPIINHKNETIEKSVNDNTSVDNTSVDNTSVDNNSTYIKFGKSYNKLVKQRTNQLRKSNIDFYNEITDPVYQYYFGND